MVSLSPSYSTVVSRYLGRSKHLSIVSVSFISTLWCYQVSSNLQDPSQYSGRSQQCCSLDSLHLSSHFQVLQSLYQPFSDCTECTNYNWYHRHFQIPGFFFQFSWYQSLFSLSFSFTLWSAGTESPLFGRFSLFLLTITRSCRLAELKVIRLYLKIPENFLRLIFLEGFRVVHIPFVCMVKFKLLVQFSVGHFAHPVVSSLIFLLILTLMSFGWSRFFL